MRAGGEKGKKGRRRDTNLVDAAKSLPWDIFLCQKNLEG
jgi:hypothetical protein